MTEYAFRARLLDITDISVAIEMSAVGNLKHNLHIGNSSFQQPEEIKVSRKSSLSSYLTHLNIQKFDFNVNQF